MQLCSICPYAYQQAQAHIKDPKHCHLTRIFQHLQHGEMRFISCSLPLEPVRNLFSNAVRSSGASGAAADIIDRRSLSLLISNL